MLNKFYLSKINQESQQQHLIQNEPSDLCDQQQQSTLMHHINSSMHGQQTQVTAKQHRDFIKDLQMENMKNTDPSTLPSHLTHEFDKIKYLPDMVKTIKKRHSISEIEGSSNHVPPLIFQRMIEKHHKNFEQLKQIKEQEQLSPNSVKERSEASPNSKAELKDQQGTATSFSQIPTQREKIEDKKPTESTNNKELTISEAETEINSSQNSGLVKSTKPIIKTPKPTTDNHSQPPQQKRRVNFNPHALLLDAAVEGELDLVVKCAKLVNDVSEPNDEGITALHNSVCAGHFDIVKFLVEFGCDINFADNDGWTPLHCAASCNNLPMVRFLIEHGASVFASTVSDNETAIKKCEEDEDGFEACNEYLNSAQENLGSLLHNNGHVYALYAYEALNEDELTFKCDDTLVVLDKNENEENDEACDGWWTAKIVNENKQGLVPNNYLGVGNLMDFFKC